MATLDYQPISSGLVDMAIVSVETNNVVSQLTVKLRARTELLPTSVDFIADNDLTKEIISRAGLTEGTVFEEVVEAAYEKVGDLHLYEMQFNAESSA